MTSRIRQTVVSSLGPMLLAAFCAVNSPVARADDGDPIVHFKSGRGRFSIPQSLFLGGDHPEEGGSDDGALLMMTWPGLQGDPDEKPGLQVLLEPIDGAETADAVLQRQLKSLTRPLQNIPKYFDGQPLAYSPITLNASTNPSSPNLERIVNAHPVPGYWWSEVYVDKPGRPDVIIACVPLDRKDLAPSCIEHFLADGLRVEITYPRAYVAEWNSIRSRLSAYISTIYKEDAK